MKPKIMIDLDSTVFKTHELIYKELKKKFNIIIDEKKNRTFDIADSYNLDRDEVWKIVKKVLQKPSLPEEPLASFYLSLIKVNYDIYFCTHRPESARKATFRQLDKLLASNGYKVQIVNDQNYNNSKTDFILEQDINLVIEDKVETILDMYKKTNTNFIIYDQPWNKDLPDTFRINRVKSWEEIYNLLSNNLRIGLL